MQIKTKFNVFRLDTFKRFNFLLPPTVSFHLLHLQNALSIVMPTIGLLQLSLNLLFPSIMQVVLPSNTFYLLYPTDKVASFSKSQVTN